MNAKLILTTIHDHLIKQGIPSKSPQNLQNLPPLRQSSRFAEGPPYILISTPHKLINIKIIHNNCQIIHWLDPYHPNATTTLIALADPQFYQKITRLLHQVLNDPS